MRRAHLTKAGFAEIMHDKHGIDITASDIPKGVHGESTMFLWVVEQFGPIACANQECNNLLRDKRECHRDHKDRKSVV